jgi:hypothetical protein
LHQFLTNPCHYPVGASPLLWFLKICYPWLTFPNVCKLPCIPREETGADSQDGAGFTIETTLVVEDPRYVKKEDGDSDNQG